MELQTVQAKLTSPPVLALPNRKGHITVGTDACDKNVGCVLLQKQPDGTTKPIGYWILSLSDMEPDYYTIHLGCLPVV